MTKCTARELLDELATTGKCDQCGDRIGESEEYGIYCGCRHHRPCRHRWRTGDGCSICELTHACDAEKAVLVEALERERDHWRAALTAWKGSETIDIDYSSALRNESGLTRILANTSPSALLAQGEMLRTVRELVDWFECAPEVTITAQEAATRIRAAPGEEKE